MLANASLKCWSGRYVSRRFPQASFPNLRIRSSSRRCRSPVARTCNRPHSLNNWSKKFLRNFLELADVLLRVVQVALRTLSGLLREDGSDVQRSQWKTMESMMAKNTMEVSRTTAMEKSCRLRDLSSTLPLVGEVHHPFDGIRLADNILEGPARPTRAIEREGRQHL